MFDESSWFYDRIYATFKDYAREAELLHDLIERLRPGARTLLDVACGTGLHLSHLSRWYEVQGLDLNEEFLETACRRNPGVPLTRADMVDFDLDRRFDVVTCLFSSIGYAKTPGTLGQAADSMARHLEPGGLLVLEPWLAPADYQAGTLHALSVDDPELKITRMNLSERRGRLSVLDFHYLVGTPDGIRHFQEHHEVGLFEDEEYMEAMSRTGLRVHKEKEGLTGRSLFVGRRAE